MTREDVREAYGEPRWVTFGILNDEVVVLVHTEDADDDRYVSLRKAEPYEANYYIETTKKYRR